MENTSKVIEGGGYRNRVVTGLLMLLFATIAARDITRPFYGLHSWDDAVASWSARAHLSYGLRYTHGFPTLAVGNPPSQPPPRYLDHPPLPALLDAGAMVLFGVNEWALRLAALIVATLSLPLLLAILRRVFDEATAVLAALLYILFPITGYFYSSPTMWSWMLPLVLLSWWCYLVLVGGLRDGPTPGVRHLWGLGIALFLMIQLGWLGVFYAAGMGSHYLIRCLRLRRPPDLRLLLVLVLCPSSSFLLDIGVLLAARGWDYKSLIGLYTWRSSVTGERGRTLAPWFGRQWDLTRSNFTLPVLIAGAAYVAYVGASAFQALYRAQPGDRARPPVPRAFTHAWLFLFPGIAYMAVFREQYWVHNSVYIPFSVPLAVAAALGILRLRDFLLKRSRLAADAALFGIMVAVVGFCARGSNIYHATRWRSPNEIAILKKLKAEMSSDQVLLSYANYWLADNPYKLTHLRPEAAWYLDRYIIPTTSIEGLEQFMSKRKCPFYLVDLVKAPRPLVEELKTRYPYEFFQGRPYEAGPPEIEGFNDQLLFDLRQGRRAPAPHAEPSAGGAPGADQPGRERAAFDEDASMNTGLEALYKQGDGRKAAGFFAQILAHNPRHYGATFQLATALDKAGDRKAARGLWSKALEMAEGYGDARTADIARRRLKEEP